MFLQGDSRAVNARLRNFQYDRGQRFAAVTRCVLPGPRTSLVRGNCVRETSVKRQNKIEITRNVANVFSFYAIIAIEHGFQCINIRQVPREVLKPQPPASVFNTFLGIWRMLMHEKPCLIPIVNGDQRSRNV